MLRCGKETYHCAGHKAHGTINMAEALRQSCNIYYIQLGQRVGSQQFYNYFDAFGFYRAHRRGPAQRDRPDEVLSGQPAG